MNEWRTRSRDSPTAFIVNQAFEVNSSNNCSNFWAIECIIAECYGNKFVLIYSKCKNYMVILRIQCTILQIWTKETNCSVNCVRLCRYIGGELSDGFQYQGANYWNMNTGQSAGSPAGVQNEDGHYFSTIDRDNDAMNNNNCASQFYGGGGWWYNGCGVVSLTGSPMGWMQYVSSLAPKTSRMMIKRQWSSCDVVPRDNNCIRTNKAQLCTRQSCRCSLNMSHYMLHCLLSNDEVNCTFCFAVPGIQSAIWLRRLRHFLISCSLPSNNKTFIEWKES